MNQARGAALTVGLLLLTAGCGDTPVVPPPPLVETPIFVSAADQEVMRAFVELLPAQLHAGLRVVADPAATLATSTEGTLHIAVVSDSARGAESYRVESAEGGYLVRGGVPLGIQFGLAHLFEMMGVRFFHPSRSFVPATLGTPLAAELGVDHAPEMDQRGLHLHILHPVESYFDFWEPGEENFDGARRTLQWIIANRGNYVTWPALLDLIAPESTDLRDHTRRIVNEAHRRGMRVGLGTQLFGGASLQKSLVLVPSGGDPATSIPSRLGVIADLPFDEFHIAFGEFSGESPEVFLASLDLAYDEIHRLFPSAEVTGTIHVGNFPDTRVTDMGEEMLYYFLVQYSTRPIIPWVHTVMYYNLFEDAGGAYNHDDFFAHRDFLLDRLATHRDVAYHPETAYWIAFDNSVPTYLPLYTRSRHYDLAQIRARTRAVGGDELGRQVVFSSGWEWGYWQNDWAVLQMSYELGASSEALQERMFAPLPGGAELASIVNELSDVQQTSLLEGRLAAYLASTDFTFPIGVLMGFWSQPRRPEFSELIAYDATRAAEFRARVLIPLEMLRGDTEALLARFSGAGIDLDEPFSAELRDGVEIDLHRTEFALAVFSAAIVRAEGGDPSEMIRAAQTAKDAAEVTIRRRHAALHDPDPASLLATRRRTALLYQYGYLREADTLCYYARELAQLDVALGGTSSVPHCNL